MNTYYILFVIVLIQLSLKYGTAQIISKTDTCEGGEKIQYGHHFECVCPKDAVHESPNKCVPISALSNCADASTDGKPCGEYAVCKEVSSSSGDYDCFCIDKYAVSTHRGKNLKSSEPGCIPTECLSVDCGNGVCRLGSDSKIMCSCKIGFEREFASSVNSKCSKASTKFQCDLTCIEEAKCTENVAGYYQCKCEDGKSVVDGKCSNAYKLFLSPLNLIFILVVSFISLKSA